MKPKQFIVVNKYGCAVGGRFGRRHGTFRTKIPYLGGTAMWYPRYDTDSIMIKIFNKVHLYGEHDTPKGKKHPYYARAAKRFYNRVNFFQFQRDRY